MARTATQQLADIRLGQSLDTYVADCRAGGMAWRAVSDDLFSRTNLRISYETLRTWYADVAVPTVDVA